MEDSEVGIHIGRGRLPILSLGNLVTLISILVTIIGAWYTISNRVEVFAMRLDSFQQLSEHESLERTALRDKLEKLLDDIRSTQVTNSTRLGIIENEVKGHSAQFDRIEQQIDKMNGRLETNGGLRNQ